MPWFETTVEMNIIG